MPAINKTFLSAAMVLFFLALTLIWLRIGLNFESTEHNYWIGFIGLGILLELSYLSIHFILQTLFFEKPYLARICSQVIAAIVALPLTILAGLLSFLIVFSMVATREEVFAYSIDMIVIILVLACPAFFLWWYAIRAIKGEPNNSLNRSAG